MSHSSSSKKTVKYRIVETCPCVNMRCRIVLGLWS
jgi:hypothetical protein